MLVVIWIATKILSLGLGVFSICLQNFNRICSEIFDCSRGRTNRRTRRCVALVEAT